MSAEKCNFMLNLWSTNEKILNTHLHNNVVRAPTKKTNSTLWVGKQSQWIVFMCPKLGIITAWPNATTLDPTETVSQMAGFSHLNRTRIFVQSSKTRKKSISSAIRVHELSDCHCAAVIKMGDKLFCTINAKWVPSHSDVEQWTYKCIVILYLLRYADNQCNVARTRRVAVCAVWGATGDGYACIYYATHTIHKDNKTCWRHAVDEWSGASRWPACGTPSPIYIYIYRTGRVCTMNTYAVWHCEWQLPIDASYNYNTNRKRNEKRRFLLHIHSIGLMERETDWDNKNKKDFFSLFYFHRN